MSVEPMIAPLAAACRFDGDLVLRAGAGTGKTYTLVEAMVHLVAGGTALGRRVPPARILALTFSEKAAAELRERARRRFLALADAPELGLGPGEWREAAAQVGAAPFATFHGFAAALLKRHAAAAGIDPAFVLLDEEEAALLERARAEEALLARLEEDETVRALVREIGFGGRGRGLVDAVLEVSARLREEGRPPSVLPGLGDDVAAADQAFAQAREDYLAALGALAVALDGRSVAPGVAARADALARLEGPARAALERLTAADDPARVEPLEEIARVTAGSLGNGARHGARLRLREAFVAMCAAHAARRAGPLAAAFGACVEAADRAWREAKRELGALDFADLILLARDLLSRDEGARAETQARFDAVLVDELQDTNELQASLLELVRAPGTPRLVVGDPKQSIYEFRGADVSVFGRIAEATGRVLALRESRRARAPLVDLLNRLFARVFTDRGGPHAFEIAFQAEDALVPVRPGEGPAVEVLASAGGERQPVEEAVLVARRVRALVDARRARFGEIAILLRRFTHLDAFLEALRRQGIPHHVVNGRGFHEAQEVRDLAHALALVDDPDDGLALLGVLRSPLVGLSDASLVTLSADGPLGLAVLEDATEAPLPADERARLEAFLHLYRRLRRHADRLGAAGLLRTLVEETDLAAVLATTWHGEQRVANLERLLELASAHDESARADRRHFTRRLRAEAMRERSLATPAQILREDDDVVRVMTVHQAKGLEFPVVFVPECGAPERNPGGAVLYDRDAGLGFRLRDAGGEGVLTPVGRRALELRRARAQAESLRLFYVATTRARDRLVLSGLPHKGTWAAALAGLLAEDEAARRAVEIVEMGDPEGRPPPAARALAEDEPHMAEGAPLPGVADLEAAAWVARAVGPPRRGAATVVAPVTELIELGECPVRHHLRHEVGLEEHPHDGVAGPTHALDARARGTLAHRVLERIDLEDFKTRGGTAVLDVLAALGEDPAGLQVAEVRRAVVAFLSGPFGKALTARRPDTILREAPFAFVPRGAGAATLLLKGQMDVVLLDEDAVTVLDYKFSRSTSAPDHLLQLTAYGVAARALFRPPRVRAGLIFLGDARPTARTVELSDEELDACEARLARLAAELAEARRTGTRAGRPLETCRALGCGYVRRCHG